MTAITATHPPAGRPGWLLPGVASWTLLTVVLAWNGEFDRTVGPIPLALILGLVLPVLIYLVLRRTHAALREWLDGLDLALLVSLHAWRTVGLVFLVLAWFGLLHPAFAWPAGAGDAIVAVWATVLAHRMRGGGVSTRQLRAWNSAGLLDFAVAVSVGVLLRPGLGLVEPPGTHVMGQFPLALIPAWLVPLFVILHLEVRRRLVRTSRPVRADS